MGTYLPSDSFAWFKRRATTDQSPDVLPTPPKFNVALTSEIGNISWLPRRRPLYPDEVVVAPRLRWAPWMITVGPFDSLPWLFRRQSTVPPPPDTIYPTRFAIAILSPLPPPAPVGVFLTPTFVAETGIRSFLSTDD
jgi:hypothetical protein